ncbi:hypothetical protein, partial [Streptomyces aureocirculatus]|uniref:hypothetical protein n=1 Tax=Streptomyces aureocirculatus TaxID=67275 RepID=UPI001BC8AC8F
MSVFVQGSGKADEWCQCAVCEAAQPARQGCRVAVVDHDGEAADQVVGELELGAVFEEPGQALVDVRAAAVRVGGDPAGRFARVRGGHWRRPRLVRFTVGVLQVQRQNSTGGDKTHPR